MPEGTPVLAAREGTVVDVEDGYREGGGEERYKGQENYVIVLHPDGTVGSYLHLRQHGVRVRPGQSVKTGDLLGESGSTG